MNKHSIKFKITLLIGGMICVLIVLLLVFNIIFSEKFYMEDKQQEMLNAYSSVNDACIQYSDDSISETDLRNNLEQISTSKGISMIIVNSDWTTFYVSTHGDEMLLERLKKSIFNNDIFQNIMKKQADKIDKVIVIHLTQTEALIIMVLLLIAGMARTAEVAQMIII